MIILVKNMYAIYLLWVHLEFDLLAYSVSLYSNLVDTYRQFSSAIVPIYTLNKSE